MEDLVSASGHSCVLTQRGRVLCFGDPVGKGLPVREGPPHVSWAIRARGEIIEDAVHVATGFATTCVLRESGEVHCVGLLPGGTPMKTEERQLFSEIEDIVELSVGPYFLCARTFVGAIWCQGSNTKGQLGDDSTTKREEPVQVVDAFGEPVVFALSLKTKWRNSCARFAGGRVMCWGDNFNQQIGNGYYEPGTLDRFEPHATFVEASEFALLEGVREVVLTDSATCALLETRRVMCWGDKDLLGVEASHASGYPLEVGLENVVELVGGAGHFCARAQDETLWCWGTVAEAFGSSEETVNTPVEAASFGPDVMHMSAGQASTCALLLDGRVQCMGSNDEGQLGIPTQDLGDDGVSQADIPLFVEF